MGARGQTVNDQDLAEAAGRLALAQAHLDLVLRTTIKTISGATLRETLDRTEKMESPDLRFELSCEFRNRCKDAALRTKLKAMLLECERMGEERKRLLHNAWAIAEDGTVSSEGLQHPWGEVVTPAALTKLASEMTALAVVLNNARANGFIARAAAAELAQEVSTAPLPRPRPESAAPVLRLSAAVPKALALSPVVSARGETTVLRPNGSSRLAIVICPNCQSKLVSS